MTSSSSSSSSSFLVVNKRNYDQQIENDDNDDDDQKFKHLRTMQPPPPPPGRCSSSSSTFATTLEVENTNSSSSVATTTTTTTENIRRGVNFYYLNAYTRHKLLINYYTLTHPSKYAQTFTRDCARDRTDFHVLLENHRFIWNEDDLSLSPDQLTWGQRVAKKYYDRLFKEYCIIDLSRYKSNQYGMRWRTEAEVRDGKGQFVCGEKHCTINCALTSWEVLFGYRERGEKHQALVKVRLCEECSNKLNYYRQHKKAKRAAKREDKRSSSSKSNSTTTTTTTTTTTVPIVKIKEEIMTDNEDNNNSLSSLPSSTSTAKKFDSNDDETTYQDLIDRIWKQPVKEEPDETETTIEEEVDDYLSQLLM